MRKNEIIMLIFGCIVLLLSLWNYSKNKDFNIIKDDSKINSVKIDSTLIKMKKQVIGRKIGHLSSFINDSINENFNNIFLYIYSGADCGTCVKNGFLITKKIKNIYPEIPLVIIGYNTKINLDKIRFDVLHSNILNDKNEIIKKQLNYIYTPSIFFINSDFIIKDIRFVIPKLGITKNIYLYYYKKLSKNKISG
ncbi:MAG: hypothetical protein K9N00_00405 [Candidatus Marinimicrobia bacterium]|nr:hypothetical protein [Candidatus Neomarinimicrobiota bacterium]